MTRRKTQIMLSIGLFIIALSQIAAHYITFSDVVKGTCIGVGIGLVIASLVAGKVKTKPN